MVRTRQPEKGGKEKQSIDHNFCMIIKKNNKKEKSIK
jgi:hypothetical protein